MTIRNSVGIFTLLVTGYLLGSINNNQHLKFYSLNIESALDDALNPGLRNLLNSIAAQCNAQSLGRFTALRLLTIHARQDGASYIRDRLQELMTDFAQTHQVGVLPYAGEINVFGNRLAAVYRDDSHTLKIANQEWLHVLADTLFEEKLGLQSLHVNRGNDGFWQLFFDSNNEIVAQILLSFDTKLSFATIKQQLTCNPATLQIGLPALRFTPNLSINQLDIKNPSFIYDDAAKELTKEFNNAVASSSYDQLPALVKKLQKITSSRKVIQMSY